jgi:hypothetical protein
MTCAHAKLPLVNPYLARETITALSRSVSNLLSAVATARDDQAVIATTVAADPGRRVADDRFACQVIGPVARECRIPAAVRSRVTALTAKLFGFS